MMISSERIILVEKWPDKCYFNFVERYYTYRHEIVLRIKKKKACFFEVTEKTDRSTDTKDSVHQSDDRFSRLDEGTRLSPGN